MNQGWGGRGGSRAGLHAATFLTLLVFGCTTVRAPASAIAPTVPVRGGAAEPQVELWLESARNVSQEESARAAAQARSALKQALAERHVPDGQTILVVRAQAVSRTGSRRNGQHAAAAGIAVGAVALVAVVVVALVASKGKSGPTIPSFGHASGTRAAPAVRPPRAAPLPVAAAPRPRIVPVRGSGVRASGGGAPAVNVDVALDISQPESEQVEDWDGTGPSDPAPSWNVPAATPAAAQIDAVTLPPPQPLDLGHRGFFDGDLLRLELVLVDPYTGTVLWVKTVEEGADVRDRAAVRKVLDRALSDPSGWFPPAQLSPAQ